MAERRGMLKGFRLGAEAMRNEVAGDLSRKASPTGLMRASEVVTYMRTIPLPSFSETDGPVPMDEEQAQNLAAG